MRSSHKAYGLIKIQKMIFLKYTIKQAKNLSGILANKSVKNMKQKKELKLKLSITYLKKCFKNYSNQLNLQKVVKIRKTKIIIYKTNFLIVSRQL